MYLYVNGNSLQKIVFSIIQILFINFNAIYYAFILTPDLKCFFFFENIDNLETFNRKQTF